jgi:hypothetical protein
MLFWIIFLLPFSEHGRTMQAGSAWWNKLMTYKQYILQSCKKRKIKQCLPTIQHTYLLYLPLTLPRANTKLADACTLHHFTNWTTSHSHLVRIVDVLKPIFLFEIPAFRVCGSVHPQIFK